MLHHGHLLAALPLLGQENAGKGLPALIGGNERFGRRLLQQEHTGAPEKNVIVAPLSLLHENT